MDELAGFLMDGARLITATGVTAPAGERAHLVGIAGAGMQALATVLLARGWRVTGSDLNPRAAAPLAKLGAVVYAGHDAANVQADARLLVYSDAIDAGNVERARAAELGIVCKSYPEML